MMRKSHNTSQVSNSQMFPFEDYANQSDYHTFLDS